MAKLNYKLPVSEYIGDFVEGDFDLTVKKNGKDAVWENETTGAKVVVEGDKLVGADEGDHFEGGKITGLTVYNGAEKVLVDISDLNLKASKLSAAFLDSGLPTALNLVTNGDDTVMGTKKEDYLFSGAGDDTLTGKGGSDTFAFHAYDGGETLKGGGAEDDIITDFDTKGNDKDYLDVEQAIDGAKGVHKGHDTLVTFDDGSTLLLEGVTLKQFQSYQDSMEM